MTDWRKLTAGALTGAICLFGLAATADAAGATPREVDVKRTQWDRRPTDNPKLDRKLNDRSERGGVGLSRVIVTFKPGVNIDSVEYLAKFAAKRGRKLTIVSGEVVELPNFMLRKLADDKRVLSIVHDRKTGGDMNRSAVVSGARAVQSLLGYDGAGVGVAVIDSGITAWHDDLGYQGNDPRVKVVAGQRTVKFVDFVNGLTTPYDDNGHGSHVAGIILGNGKDTHGARAGIAPKAHLVSLKVLDDHGGGYISNVIAALEWAVVNKARLQHPRHQPVGWRRGDRVLYDRPALPRGEARGRRRDRRRDGGRQPGQEGQRPGAVRRHHRPGQCALGADRRRLQPRGHGDPHRRQDRASTARAVPRRTTSPRSRTSSRRARGSSRCRWRTASSIRPRPRTS